MFMDKKKRNGNKETPENVTLVFAPFCGLDVKNDTRQSFPTCSHHFPTNDLPAYEVLAFWHPPQPIKKMNLASNHLPKGAIRIVAVDEDTRKKKKKGDTTQRTSQVNLQQICGSQKNSNPVFFCCEIWLPKWSCQAGLPSGVGPGKKSSKDGKERRAGAIAG